MAPRWSKIGEEHGTGRIILLAGLRYPTDRPMFAPAVEAAKARGMGITRVEFRFADDPAFMGASDEVRFEAIAEEGRELASVLGGTPAVLVGKSLGTMIMGAMIGRVHPATRWVWFTPSLNETPLLDQMRACTGPSLSVIGGADGSTPITRGANYLALPRMTHLEFAGFSHSWTHPEGAKAEARSLKEIGRTLDQWLDATGAHT